MTGPYRRPPRLSVKEKTWQSGDVLVIGRARWIIDRVFEDGRIVLVASNGTAIRWSTTLDRIPTKQARR